VSPCVLGRVLFNYKSVNVWRREGHAIIVGVGGRSGTDGLTLPKQGIINLLSNIYPTRCNVTQFILSGNCSTCFGWYHHPSLGAQTTVSKASGICHTVTATCRYQRQVEVTV